MYRTATGYYRYDSLSDSDCSFIVSQTWSCRSRRRNHMNYLKYQKIHCQLFKYHFNDCVTWYLWWTRYSGWCTGFLLNIKPHPLNRVNPSRPVLIPVADLSNLALHLLQSTDVSISPDQDATRLQLEMQVVPRLVEAGCNLTVILATRYVPINWARCVDISLLPTACTLTWLLTPHLLFLAWHIIWNKDTLR
jgi:hypothetical protein